MKTVLSLALAATMAFSAPVVAEDKIGVEEYFAKQMQFNPNVKNFKAHVLDQQRIDNSDWSAYRVSLKADLKTPKGNGFNPVEEERVFFSNGRFITPELTDMKNGRKLTYEPAFLDKYYADEFLLTGNKDARHKIAIFSDPLCPACKGYVPEALSYLAKYPEEFAVYYYHFPLTGLHPAAETLVKAEIALAGKEQGGDRLQRIMSLYKTGVAGKEPDEQKILDAFNLTMGASLKMEDLQTDEVTREAQSAIGITRALAVGGTPTVYFDGKLDPSRSKYRAVATKAK